MEEKWIDITTVGSQYEEQLEIYSGKHRHRELKMGKLALFEEKGIGQWKPGIPPNAPHEGPGAASSRTVPLDAVVGGQRDQ